MGLALRRPPIGLTLGEVINAAIRVPVESLIDRANDEDLAPDAEFANRIAPQLVIHGLVRSGTPFRCSRRFSFRITPTTLPPPAHRSQRFRSEDGRSKRSARAGETPSIRSGEPDGSRQPDVPMRFGNSPGSTSPRRANRQGPRRCRRGAVHRARHQTESKISDFETPISTFVTKDSSFESPISIFESKMRNCSYARGNCKRCLRNLFQVLENVGRCPDMSRRRVSYATQVFCNCRLHK